MVSLRTLMCMDLCHTRGQAKGTGLKKLGKGWVLSCGKTSTPRAQRYYIETMIEPITKLDDAYEFFYDSGHIIMRLKPHITNKTPLNPKLESLKILISQNHPKNK